MGRIKFLTAIPMLMTLIACGSKESVEITANTNIPVRPHSITQSLLNLMNIAPVGECYQDQIYLALHDIQADKFVATKKVKLRTSLISAVPLHTPSYINSGPDIDDVIYRLVHNSFLDEPLTMLVPKDRPYEIGLMGNFSKPVDANDDGICDQINLIQAPSYLISDDQSLSSPRTRHAAINLPNGKILVAGGINATALNTAEVYDPISRTWGATDNVISAARAEATASVIKPGIYAGTNAGKVLLVGGVTATGTSVAATELYTPSSNSWQITNNPTPASARRGHTATALNDGRVLIAGGIESTASLNSTSIYNPSIAAWATAGTMNQSRNGHTATLIKGGTYAGQVLIIGGAASQVIERFNPNTNTWTAITPTGTFVARYAHTATLLPDGKILIAGGQGYPPSASVIGDVDIFDPDTNTWDNKGIIIIPARREHTASLLPDGRVLIAGGSNGSMSLNSLLLSNFNYTAFTVSATLNHNRTLHTTNSLPDGSIIFSGGIAFSASLDSVEHLQLVKPALNSSSLIGHALVNQNAMSAGSIDLRIDVLHSNFNATALDYSSFISINPNKFKDWVELPNSEFITTAGGTAKLDSVSLLKDNDSAPMINMKLVHGLGMTNYVPNLFPLVLEFNYLGTTAGACSNALPYCSGRYRAVIFNSDPFGTSLVATLIPGTGSTGSTPPATINSNLIYPFIINTF